MISLAGGGGSGPAASGGGGSGPAASGGGGSANIAQHREYLLHGGRYASCVHAGGLSCFKKKLEIISLFTDFSVRNVKKVPKSEIKGIN